MHGSQHKIPLHVHALQIGHGIAGRKRTRPMACSPFRRCIPAFRSMVRSCAGVAVIHIAGNVEFHAAHLIDEIDKDIQIDEHIAVGRKPTSSVT